MSQNYSYFAHKECEYFPCHKGADPENFNCLFCYCPLYALGRNCGGAFQYKENGIKDCTNCLFPHRRENYQKVIARYKDSLTASIKELENELQVTLFRRTNKGVTLTPEGEEFLGYARQVNSQLDLMRERYFGGAPVRRRFCVSTQHYSFAVEAFVALLKEHGGETYDFHLRETQTYEIIEDVALLKSEVGVLYLSPFNETVLKKTIKAHGLGFHLLFKAQPHVFLGAENPLAKRKSITLEDLAPYPRLSYEQGDHNAFYFSEEIQSTLECAKDIHVCDRATLFNLLIGLNGYTICSGVINESLNGKNIVAVPLNLDDYMEIGYLTRENVEPSLFAQYYIDALKKFTMQ